MKRKGKWNERRKEDGASRQSDWLELRIVIGSESLLSSFAHNNKAMTETSGFAPKPRIPRKASPNWLYDAEAWFRKSKQKSKTRKSNFLTESTAAWMGEVNEMHDQKQSGLHLGYVVECLQL